MSASIPLSVPTSALPCATGGEASFAGRIVVWQRQSGRQTLPWQHQRDPYRVWLSEVMLQQTQVTTVIPYYERFLQAFADVTELARADIEQVLQLWSGLGYYSRARNLHRCAKQVVERFEGQFPDSLDALMSLPGIGRSTAAAIAAFAFGQREAILDGNVKRVFCRHFAVDGFPGERKVEQHLWWLVERELPFAGIEAYTQGLMDLGATICTRNRPACALCPVATSCIALREQRVASLPTRRARRAPPLRHGTLLLVRDGERILMQRRPPSGIWGGLWSLPELGDDDAHPLPKAELSGVLGAYFAAKGVSAGVKLDRLRDAAQRPLWLPPFTHAFTHYTLQAQPVLLELASLPSRLSSNVPPAVPHVADMVFTAEPVGWRWIRVDEVEQAALPSPIRALLLRVMPKVLCRST